LSSTDEPQFDPYDDTVPVSMRMGSQRLLEPRPVFDPEGRFGPPNDEMPPGGTPWVDPWPDPLSHEGGSKPKREKRSKQPKPALASVQNSPFGVPQQPDEPTPGKPPRDRRESASTACELLGLALFSAGFWWLAIWAGLIVTGLCLVVFGVATSNQFPRRQD
jgi:hypothetical protein